MTELEGQMALFDIEGCEQEIRDEHADELCQRCGGGSAKCCTASEVAQARIAGLRERQGSSDGNPA